MNYFSFLFLFVIKFVGIFAQNSSGNQIPSESKNKPVSEEEQEDLRRGLNDMVLIPAGIYQVGTDDVIIESDNEGPKRMVELSSFYLDKYEVSNEEFSRFVAETNYKTSAEKNGESGVFHMFLNNTFKEKHKDDRGLYAPWWYSVKGADWRHPYGPDSNISNAMDHPVAQISWTDARVYCAWRGARLPTEAEWEGACRAGHYDITYPWGNTLFPKNTTMNNNWQGTFPTYNSKKDGYIGACPVWEFPPNEFGLYNMIANVWEWTEDNWSETTPDEKVFKGGSFLCHHSYCFRYRCSARTSSPPGSSGVNIGFRCAKSFEETE